MDKGAENWRRYLDGDDDALAELITDYRDGLIFFLRRFVGDIRTAEELAEDTFVRLVTKRPHFSGRSAFKTWLYAIGRNEARHYLRRRVHMPLDETVCAHGADPEEAYLMDERKVLLHRALGQLEPDYRQALWLVYFEDFSSREVAEILGRSVHATEMLLTRARRALKYALCKEGYPDENL